MSLLKYFGETGDQHGGKLTWPGTGAGFPVRNPGHLDLKQDEYDDIPHVFDFKCRLFDLRTEHDRIEYAKVMDRIANGWFAEKNRIERWDDGDTAKGVPPGPIIWLEWLQIYGEIPNEKHPGFKTTAQSISPHSILGE